MKSRILPMVLSGLMLSGLAMAQAADAATLVVVEARGINLAPGATLDSERPLALKQGQHVTLVSDTGSTLKLDGPYNRPPSASGTAGIGLSSTLGALLTQRQTRSGEFGTTRGTVLAALPDPWLVDVTHSGSGCVQENHMPVFWRPDSNSEASLSVAPADRSWKSQTRWPAGRDRISVTTDVPMRTGQTYVITFNGTDYAIAMTLVPAALTNDDMRAAWMADKGCEAQAQALMKTVK
jgi:hypothetical protein